MLNRSRQLKTFRFGGLSAPPQKTRGKDFNPRAYLKSLKKADFTQLFYEWVAQCWIYDFTEKVPTEPGQLETFELDDLIPEFKKRYESGDWKVVVENSGASIDEMWYFYQMLFKQKVVFMLNKNRQPPPFLPEAAQYYFIPEDVIFPIYLEFTKRTSSMVMITDGVDHHLFTPFYYDEDRKKIQYIDNIGEGGKHFLNKENNAMKIDAKFLGHDNKGNWCWEISVDEFQKIFFGTPLIASFADLWNWIAMEIARVKMENSFFNKYRKL